MDLEYKTIQAQTPLFTDSKKMHDVLETEAKAGWQLLWKEDNYKLKLQREISHRDNDKNLAFDAYRSTVGVSSTVTYVGTALLTIAIVSVILYFAIWTS